MKQFTATVYILDQASVLLIYHRKHKKWLPPGGHVEPHELPSEAAIREAKEETGLDIELILQENVWVKRWNAKSFERPYLCLVEEIPPHGNEPAHQHVDFIYIARPLSKNIDCNWEETEGVRWFTIEEVRLLEKDVEIFVDTFLIIEHLLSTDKAAPSYPELTSV